MPLPQFVKSGVPTVELSRVSGFPDVEPLVLNQFVGVSDANTVKVASLGPPMGTIVLQFKQLTRTDRANIYAFFDHPLVNYGRNAFTFIDNFGVSHSVQYLEPQLALPLVSKENVSFDLILTKV